MPLSPASPFTLNRTAPVLLFDGECGLCHRLVRLLLRIDRYSRLRFAPLQGRAAQDYLRLQSLPTVDFDTLVYVPDWNGRDRPDFLLRTAGVVAALRITGNPVARAVAAMLALFPAPVRDAGYRMIARGRYRVFGPWRARPLGRSEWADRFLT